MFQSTHPHGVRHLPEAEPSVPECFNPRTHTGCDLNAQNLVDIFGGFQSTHPHGVRLLPRLPLQALISFNPRTHTGCDWRFRLKLLRMMSFNPRTHTGCDFFVGKLVRLISKFQSTHPHGVRQRHVILNILNISFNPRTHTGCDSCRHVTVLRTPGFNPRTHTGCDMT